MCWISSALRSLNKCTILANDGNDVLCPFGSFVTVTDYYLPSLSPGVQRDLPELLEYLRVAL